MIASTTHDMRQPPPGAFLPLLQLLAANRVTVPHSLIGGRTSLPSSIISCVGIRGGWAR